MINNNKSVMKTHGWAFQTNGWAYHALGRAFQTLGWGLRENW